MRRKASGLSVRATCVLVVLAFMAVGCGGSALRRDARRLSRCDVIPGRPVTETQARCVARIYGVRDSRRCPMQVARLTDADGPAFRVFESCNGLGVIVAESTGRVVAVVNGEAVLHGSRP